VLQTNLPSHSSPAAAQGRGDPAAHVPSRAVTLATISLFILVTILAVQAASTRDAHDMAARAAMVLTMRESDARRAEALFAPSAEPRLFTVTVTAYSPTPDQTWGDPWIGAMGRRVRPGKTLAVSHDLKHLLGSRVYVQGVGYLVAEDLMHPRWENRVDLCLRSRNRAEAFGVKQLDMVVLD